MTISVIQIPVTYTGHFTEVTDIIDGAYGDEDYEVQEYSYMRLIWETTE